MATSTRKASPAAIKSAVSRMAADAFAKANRQPAFDPSNYTEDQLSGILRAFFDITDGVPSHEFAERTGDQDPAAAKNFADSQKLVQGLYVPGK